MTDSAQHVSVRRGVYHDSVTLLRLSQAAADTPGVTAAQVAMATPLNTELAAGLGFSIPAGDRTERPVDHPARCRRRGGRRGAGRAGVGAVRARSSRPSGVAGVAPARTVRSAAAAHPDAPLVLLSVPGSAVLGEALDAIDAGRHVMIFSDNVPLADEIALKDAAAAAGVLVMGPDCGTAIISGVGLGFANVLQDNGSAPRVGIVAASGTGAQQLTCLLDDAGVAVSHVLGVGGRDLSEAVGGRSATAALRMLDADPSTDHIVLISKPPHPATAAAIGAGGRVPRHTGEHHRDGPRATRHHRGRGGRAPGRSGWQSRTGRRWAPESAEAGTVGAAGSLRGLFSGGTLADEAMVVAGAVLGDIRSNIPLRPDLALPSGPAGHGVPRSDRPWACRHRSRR